MEKYFAKLREKLNLIYSIRCLGHAESLENHYENTSAGTTEALGFEFPSHLVSKHGGQTLFRHEQ